jgi:hypothetical protein
VPTTEGKQRIEVNSSSISIKRIQPDEREPFNLVIRVEDELVGIFVECKTEFVSLCLCEPFVLRAIDYDSEEVRLEVSTESSRPELMRLRSLLIELLQETERGLFE